MLNVTVNLIFNCKLLGNCDIYICTTGYYYSVQTAGYEQWNEIENSNRFIAIKLLYSLFLIK